MDFPATKRFNLALRQELNAKRQMRWHRKDDGYLRSFNGNVKQQSVSFQMSGSVGAVGKRVCLRREWLERADGSAIFFFLHSFQSFQIEMSIFNFQRICSGPLEMLI